jgi:type IV secretion system protein VirB8
VAVDRALEGYFEEAASWDADRAAQYRRSARYGWAVAGAGWFAVVLLCAALMLLMPLKRVEPLLIRVNSTTGVVDVVPVYAGSTALPQAVTRYFLTHYVTVCERFDFATAESDYQECGAFQTAQGNEKWYARWNPNNPASPLNLYKDGSTVRAEVSAVSFFKRANGITDLAQVRYRTVKQPAGGGTPDVTDWIATVEYAYVKPSGDPKTREWNPLGFKIVDFETEREALTDSPHGAGESVPSITSQAPGGVSSAEPVASAAQPARTQENAP